MFDPLTVEPLELIDAGGDEVVAVLRIGGRAKLSGVETEITFAIVYAVRDGKIARGHEYATRSEARSCSPIAITILSTRLQRRTPACASFIEMPPPSSSRLISDRHVSAALRMRGSLTNS